MKVVTKCVELLVGKHGVKVALHVVGASAFQDFRGLCKSRIHPNKGCPLGSSIGALAEVKESLGFAFAHREEQIQKWSVTFARSLSQARRGVSSGDES